MNDASLLHSSTNKSDALVTQKEQFDQMSLHLLSNLELYEEVSSIEVSSSSTKAWAEIIAWEKKHFPYKLPGDLKDFYSAFNGLDVKWKVDVAGKLSTIGNIKFLPISEIQRIASEGIYQLGSRLSLDFKTSAIFVFEILSMPFDGKIALVYRQPEDSSASPEDRIAVHDGLQVQALSRYHDSPEIWLQDSCKSWHFICDSFLQYFRLVVTHMAIVGWQQVNMA